MRLPFSLNNIGRTLLAVLCVLSILVHASTLQAQIRPTRHREVTFAGFVPQSAGLFVQMRRFGKVDDVVRRTRVRGLFSPAGSWPAVGHADLMSGMAATLGPTGATMAPDLATAEVGLAVGSNANLADAVWFVRLADENLIERWFPNSERTDTEETGRARLYVTPDNIIACIRDDIAAIGQRKTDNPLLNGIIELMAGVEETALRDSQHFKSLTAHLPPGHLAFAYFTADKTPDPDVRKPPLFGPDFTCAAAGMYERQDRVDLAVRGILRTPRLRTRLNTSTIDKVLALPRTTLVAYATTIDFNRVYELIAQSALGGSASRYLPLFKGLADPELVESGMFSEVGPDVVIAWEQNLRSRGGVQLAVLVQCDRPQALLSEMERIARKAFRVLRMIDTGKSDPVPEAQHLTYMGRPIVRIPLAQYAEQSRFPFVKLLGESSLCFAAIDDWFVFALSPGHLKRIIQSENNLIPRLSAVEDVRQTYNRSARSDSFLVCQPALASGVIQRWLVAFQNGSPSLLDPTWWQPRRPSPRQRARRFGIGMRARQEPGAVAVARVYPGTASDGQLDVGDIIIGVDGRILSLEKPNADLRKRLLNSREHPGPKLRILRGETIMDVQLTLDSNPPGPGLLPFTPANAAAELALITRELQFASLAVKPSGGTHYAAECSLRFVEED